MLLLISILTAVALSVTVVGILLGIKPPKTDPINLELDMSLDDINVIPYDIDN